MLVGQHGGRHQYGHLLRIACSLESGTNSHLGLTEAHIATHQTVHRPRLLHICFHVVGSLQLVGRILVKERRLQFVLHKRIGRVGKTLLLATGGIQLDEVAGNILQFLLGTLLHALPLARAQMRHARRLATVLRLVFRHLVQRVDRHIDGSPTLVHNLNHFLILLAISV